MSLTALNIASTGLQVTQSAISIVAENVANAGTAGYVRRRLDPVEQTVAGQGAGVRTGAVERVYDTVAQRQVRLETAGAAYTSLTANVTGQLDALYGTPGDASALDGVVNTFAGSLQTLAADPGSSLSRQGVVSAGRALATQLNTISNGVQALRTDAEGRLGTDVRAASGLLKTIAGLNAQIAASPPGSAPGLADQRDQAVNQLAQYMDVRTSDADDGSVTVYTGSGVTLVDHANAASLSFDGRTDLAAGAVYSTDPTKRGVGTITATTPSGGSIDLVATGAIRSGSIAASLDLRDGTLVQAQRQLDDLAAGLAGSLSDGTVSGTPTGTGSTDIDLTGLTQPGNTVSLSVTDATGRARTVLLVATKNGATPDPNLTNDPTAIVRGVDVSGASGTIAAAVNAALAGTGITAAAGTPATDVRLTPDGVAAKALGAVQATTTQTALAGGGAALPLFTDTNGRPYTGSFDGGAAQLTGFAARVTLNPGVVADTSTLVAYAPGVGSGDATRPQFLYDRLTSASRTFSAGSAIGGAHVPYAGTVQDFAQRIIEGQGANAATAQQLDEGQQVALTSAQSRFADAAGVSVDQEMSQLIQLQTAYSANARVMTAARDMLDTLLRI